MPENTIYNGIDINRFKITCPYCFNEFSHAHVHFRAKTGYRSKREIEVELGYSKGDAEASEDEKRLAAFELREKYYMAGMSTNLKKYWADFEGVPTEPVNQKNLSSIKPWEYPVLDNRSIHHLLQESDGMVDGCVDLLGNETHSRVCPFCNNPLPKGYGKYPIKKIAIVGITNSGKTVYISQLLNIIEDYAPKVGISAYPKSDNEYRFIKDNRIEKGIEVPKPTTTKHLSQPMFYDISKRDRSGKGETTTIVLYDIAGENCESVRQLEESRFAKFIKQADGIILLIDPAQLFSNHDANVGKPNLVVNTLHNLGLESDTKDNNRCKIPIAVTISKSDTQMDILPYMAQDEVQQTGLDELKRPLIQFNAKYYNQLQSELDNLINNNAAAAALRQALFQEYQKYNWFAICAIGCNIIKITNEETGMPIFVPETVPMPKRIEEPMFWLFKQFGFIGTNDKVNLPSYRVERVNTFQVKKGLFGREKLIPYTTEVTIKDEESLEAFLNGNMEYFIERN